jgi:energy-coupling factor transport system permease protein
MTALRDAPTTSAQRARRGVVARHRHPAAHRNLHPGAWWLWAGGLAAAAMRTTNVLLLGLIIGVVSVVVAARRTDAPWARSFSSFLKLGAFVVVFQVVLQLLIGNRVPGSTLFTLPSVDLPSWMAGMSLGGRVTAEGLVASFQHGLQLATVLVCFGAVNSLCSPYRMLQALPATLYEAGVVVTVALSFAPQAVIQLGRIREARRLRGRPVRGVAALRGLALPVLEGGLERSLALAASMDSRGYGRRAESSPRTRRWATGVTVLGLMAVAVGLYGLADAGAPAALGFPVIGLGAVGLAVSLFATGRRSPRTRYRPDPWRAPEWLVSLAGLAALFGMMVTARLAGGGNALDPATSPLTWPLVPMAGAIGIAVALLPAVLAPIPPMASGPEPGADP